MVATMLSNLANTGSQWRRGASVGETDQIGQTFRPEPDFYELAEAYYQNRVYERADSRSSAIKSWLGLPRNIRPVFSIVKSAVEWWPGSLYGGAWTSDGLPTGSGKPNRIAYDTDTPEALRIAVQQLFSWGNWGSEILVYALLHAMLGDVFAEIEVDYERRKVYPVLHHPKFVTDIEWNRSGDVVRYRLDIPQKDKTGTSYRWGKIVTKETVTTLYNGEPHGYDDREAVTPNSFGLAPAVWVMHRNIGGQHGACCFHDLWASIDELQGIGATHSDYIHKFTRQGVIIETPDTKGFNVAIQASTKRGGTAEFENPNLDRESVPARAAPVGTRVHRLIENLGLGESYPHRDALIANIEMNLPELAIEQKLADMANVTGPGARAIVAPMQRRVDETAGNSYAGIVKLGQMGTSIMGELVNTGAFGIGSQLTEAQKKFLPFRLDSYDKGDLAFSLQTPVLVQPTRLELAMEAAAIEKLTLPSSLAHVGYSDDEIYGEGNAPLIKPGIISEQAVARTSAGDGFATLFNSGNSG